MDLNKPKVIFEDIDLLVIDKPAGWVVNNADTVRGENIIQKWIENNYDFELAKSIESRNGIVHRLDKDTSGILLVAKNKKTFQSLQDMFKKRTIQKTYIALVHGKITSLEDSINVPLGRMPANRKRFGVIPGGRESITQFKLVSYYKIGNQDLSLLKLFPKTGRTHQIRVHLKYLGYPIVSDIIYTGRKRVKADLKWCPRMFLHATEIEFEYPLGTKRSFLSKLPSDLNKTLSSLENIPQTN